MSVNQYLSAKYSKPISVGQIPTVNQCLLNKYLHQTRICRTNTCIGQWMNADHWWTVSGALGRLMLMDALDNYKSGKSNWASMLSKVLKKCFLKPIFFAEVSEKDKSLFNPTQQKSFLSTFKNTVNLFIKYHSSFNIKKNILPSYAAFWIQLLEIFHTQWSWAMFINEKRPIIDHRTSNEYSNSIEISKHSYREKGWWVASWELTVCMRKIRVSKIIRNYQNRPTTSDHRKLKGRFRGFLTSRKPSPNYKPFWAYTMGCKRAYEQNWAGGKATEWNLRKGRQTRFRSKNRKR